MEKEFQWVIDRFDDVKIMRYRIPGFEALSLNQKLLLYHLSLAANEGRDILFDQNGKYNLLIRKVLEYLVFEQKVDDNTEEFKALEVYLKKVWFANGIHHHYSMDKFKPSFSKEYFEKCLGAIDQSFWNSLKVDIDQTITLLLKVIFDDTFLSKRVSLADGVDVIKESANNYYAEDLTQSEVEAFYKTMTDESDSQPVSSGLNSTLIKQDGTLVEDTWKVGGKYGKAIEKIVGHLQNATAYAENLQQEKVIQLLIKYYETGNLKTFDAYNIEWLKDELSDVDFINGFIETYGDALGLKGSWESLVNFKNKEASQRTEIISKNAQWFEDHSPVDERFKKKTVKGVSAKVITAVMLGGDCYPATPIGINLPNADWIRAEYGSKSVTIENITYAYDAAKKGDGFLQEFAWSEEEVSKAEKYGFDTDNLHTDLHECLGHGSGQLLPGVKGDELKAYGATIEEARADLFGLYYMMDPKLVELGLLPNSSAPEAAYDAYIRNGLMTQLTRIEPGNNLEESHMRNRQLIAAWAFEKGQTENVIEKMSRDNKTYFVINDYSKLRHLFGQLLNEIQRIKSEGDYNAAKILVETYAVKVDLELNQEVKQRFAKLNLAPYAGFVNPQLQIVKEKDEVKDVEVVYSENYTDQMLRYSRVHSWLI